MDGSRVVEGSRRGQGSQGQVVLGVGVTGGGSRENRGAGWGRGSQGHMGVGRGTDRKLRSELGLRPPPAMNIIEALMNIHEAPPTHKAPAPRSS